MLLDTSGLLCLFDRRDHRHTAARDFYGKARRHPSPILTHDGVLAEFVALAQARGAPRLAALNFVNDLLANPAIEIIWTDELWHRTALTFLLARLDKTYSLCDAISFLLMRDRALTNALTTDRHFEQEGFVRLLSF